MDSFLVIVNIVILLALILGLYALQKKHVKFSNRVLIALGLGLLFGIILNIIYGTSSVVVSTSMQWFNIVGSGYTRLLQMVVMPLVLISIIAAFTKIKLSKNIGKISFYGISILLVTTGIAAVIGIAATLGFGLDGVQLEAGEAENARITQLEERVTTVENLTIPDQILSFIPTNPFADLTGARSTSTIAVVIFAALIGLAFLGMRRKHPEQAEQFASIVDTFYSITMRIVTIVIRLTPYGILAIMTRAAATTNYEAILNLGQFVIASYVAIIAMFLVHLLLVSLAKLNPITYVKKGLPVLTFAFTSRSSASSLPLNIKTQTDGYGVSQGVANFVGPFSVTIGQNGCAGIYPAMLAVMVAPTVGINPLDIGFLLTLIVVVMIGSFGVAGVGGGATFASLIVLSVMNLPIAIVALLISVEPLIDMGRTALNVSGGMTSGILTGRLTGELDEQVFNEKTDLSDVAEV